MRVDVIDSRQPFADLDVDAEFLAQLTGQSLGSRLPGIDLASRKFPQVTRLASVRRTLSEQEAALSLQGRRDDLVVGEGRGCVFRGGWQFVSVWLFCRGGIASARIVGTVSQNQFLHVHTRSDKSSLES